MQDKKFYPWFVVAMLWGVGLLNYMDRQMFATMQDSISIDIVELQSAEAFGALMGIFLWIYGFMSPIAGAVADKINRKWLLLGSLFVWSGVTYLMGYANTYHELYILRAAMGVSEALYLPTALAVISDYHRKKTRSLAIGVHMTGLYIGSALGGFGGTVAHIYGWHFTFHSLGIVGMGYALVLIFFLHEYKGHKKSTEELGTKLRRKPPLLKGFAVLFSNMAFWVILFFFAVPSLPGWATKNWLPTLFSRNLEMDMSTAGPFSTITLAVASLIGVIFGGWLSDKWVQVNIKGRVYTSAIGLALMIPGLLFLGIGHSVVALLAAGLCFGIGFGIFDANNMPILCQFVSSKYRATGYGIMNMIGVFFGAFITDFLGKSTDSGNLGRDFAILGGIVLLALIVQLSFLRPEANDYDEVIAENPELER